MVYYGLAGQPARHWRANIKAKSIIKKAKPQSLLPLVTPAASAEIIVPSPSFPIVGIGASAGGLAAFEAFFSGMPSDADPDMAFVLVQHLAPDYKSILSELIQRFTRMQVFEVSDGMAVRPNCAYIIPPNRDMAFLNGTLHLLEPTAPRGHRMAIDFFFRSLAQDQHERAIGVVLSGTGSDGTLGVRAIKGAGGMVMAQSPGTTEFDSMPRSAIAAGVVDYELPPAEMPARIIGYVAHAFGKLPRPTDVREPKAENALKRIFILLRTQTGHDFSQYKPSTIDRRIERRMAVHQIESMDGYVKYLQQTPVEIEALFHDLLIGVTNFFRDPKAFQALEEEVVPKLFSDKSAGATVRVWSTGCSTGEEAYSVAILLQERMEALKQSYTVQVFATDIDSRAIATARAGLYPSSVAADVSPERLARFFTAEPDGGTYRIHKSIRDMLVFSEQDVIKDPPFSRLDLICCRNLLIYLGADLQKKLIPLFHYALKPGGMLFLGSSEGIGGFDELFAVLDRKAKLYQRKEDYRGTHLAMGRFLEGRTRVEGIRPRSAGKPSSLPKLEPRDLTEQAILQTAPCSVLIDSQGDILYQHGRSGMFLEPAPGITGTSNILKMAREGLRPALTAALRAASEAKNIVRCARLRVKTNGHFSMVNLTIHPVNSGSEAALNSALFLVSLEDASLLDPETMPQTGSGAEAETHEASADIDARIVALMREMRAKDEYIKNAHEELKSSNEEMQSVNEELQSTNEELETSKEELQSVNEELATVNTELQTKVASLSQANNDMNNLLAGTGIGTIFVDLQLRILRFTPAAKEIVNLIPGDMGRPVGHLVSNLIGYDRMAIDIQKVLDTLAPIASDVKATNGNWYTMRIQPYRTLNNVIEGAVISFVNITETVLIRDSLRKANELLRLAVVVRDAHDAITVQDLQGRILAWNPGAVNLYGWSEEEALSMNVRDRIPIELREEASSIVRKLELAETVDQFRTKRLAKDGTVLEVSMIATALLDETGNIYAIATTERASSP